MDKLIELINEDLKNKGIIMSNLHHAITFIEKSNDIVIFETRFNDYYLDNFIVFPDKMLMYFKQYLHLTFPSEVIIGGWIRIKYANHQLNCGLPIYL